MCPNVHRVVAWNAARVFALVGFAAFIASPSVAWGQTITRHWFGDTSYQRFGTWMRFVGDVNADGFVDLGITAPSDSTSFPGAGMLRVVSGADGSILDTWYGDEKGAAFAVLGDPIGDVDLDGYDDVLAGEPYYFGGSSRNKGRVVVYSGRSGSVLLRVDGTSTYTVGGPLAGTGDLDADGIPDFAVSTYQNVRIVSGASGSLIRLLSSPNLHHDNFGNGIADAGDLDGDSFHDLLVVENGCYYNATASCYAFSGKSGSILWTESLGNCYSGSAYWSLGISPRSVGDVNGDGIPDWIVGDWGQGIYSGGGGFIECHSGKDGSLIDSIIEPSWLYACWYCGNHFGQALAPAGDVNGDGVPDIVAGDDRSYDDPGGDLFFFSGVDGTMLFHFRGPAVASAFGASVEGGLDIDHDGRLDVIAGDPQDATKGAYAGAAAQVTFGDLILDVAPHSVRSSEFFSISVNSGPPGNPIALVLIDLNGTPLFQPVELTTFDPSRRWSLYQYNYGTMSGLSATLRAFALDAAGRLVVSNDETITFQ